MLQRKLIPTQLIPRPTFVAGEATDQPDVAFLYARRVWQREKCLVVFIPTACPGALQVYQQNQQGGDMHACSSEELTTNFIPSTCLCLLASAALVGALAEEDWEVEGSWHKSPLRTSRARGAGD